MTQRSFVHALSRASLVLLLAITACGDDDSSETDAGPSAGKAGGSAGKGGSGGKGGAGGRAGTSSTTAGTTAMTAGVGGGLMAMCTEDPPKDPVKCGDETCTAPMEFAMNMCVVPCCVKVNGKDRCASKSTAAMLSTECSLPAVPDSQCPDVAGGMGMGMMGGGGMSFKGCCNAQKKKCGIISTLRPGCITESMLITLPNPLQDCTPPAESSDDAGVSDAG